MSRRSVSMLGVALAALAGAGGVAASPAAAQVGYPPGPCTAMVSTQAIAGPVTVGSTFVVNLTPVCAWAPGAPVTVTVNGQVVATKAARVDGTVSVTVTVVSPTTLSIDDPVLVPAVCGPNSVTGAGGSSVAGGTVTNTTTFSLNCTSVLAATSSRGVLSFTGANVLRWSGAALGMVVVGGVVTALTRRRRAAGRLTATPSGP